MHFVFKKKNEKVCYYGDKGDLFYIILQGEVAVILPTEEQKIKLQRVNSLRMTR